MEKMEFIVAGRSCQIVVASSRTCLTAFTTSAEDTMFAEAAAPVPAAKAEAHAEADPAEKAEAHANAVPPAEADSAAEAAPAVLLVEPVDRRDLEFIGREVDYLQEHAGCGFALVTFVVEDWNSELSPWVAEPVFGKEAFGDGAKNTLRFIEHTLIPEVLSRIPALKGRETVLGGYSLAALFALWAGYESSRFHSIAAASPSVWFPGWMDYAKARTPQAKRIYLSLGDAEPKTRNRVMATVGDCIREMDALLADTPHTLEWNPGNHFKDADLRTAKAFAWCTLPMSLHDEMLAAACPAQVPGLCRFFKTGPGQYGEGDKFLGIKVPVTREIVRRCWKSTDLAELERCMASEYHEMRLAALLTLVQIFSHAKTCPAGPMASARAAASNNTATSASTSTAAASNNTATSASTSTAAASNNMATSASTNMAAASTNTTSASNVGTGISKQQCIDFYLSHTSGINNWDLVDLSCYPLLGEWLLDKDRTLLYNLARNGHTIWEQRIGMVSTMTFIRHGQLQDTFAMADILLRHPHDLIHKAVGWLLREAGKRDQAALEAYLLGVPEVTGQGATESVGQGATDGHDVQASNLPRYRQMPRTMLRYAIERLPEAQRQRYLKGQV